MTRQWLEGRLGRLTAGPGPLHQTRCIGEDSAPDSEVAKRHVGLE